MEVKNQIKERLYLIKKKSKKSLRFLSLFFRRILVLFLDVVFRFLPLKKNIVFESESDMDDNPRAVYEYLLDQGYNTNHKLVWIVKNVPLCRELYKKNNVVFISRFDKCFKNKVVLNYYLETSKWFVFSHPYWFYKKRKKQIVIHVSHGTGPKGKRTSDKNISKSFDFLIVSGEQSKHIILDAWDASESQMLPCGFPRIDLFNKGNKDTVLSKIFNYQNGDKVIICMPTFKQSWQNEDSTNNDMYLLDFIDSYEQLCMLNNALIEKKIHLIIKPHPLQRTDILCLTSLSNIHYFTNNDLLKKKIQLYEVVGKCDALITDLSSIYTDFLYLNKPIGFLIKSIKEYNRGYNIDNPLDYMPGKHIASYDDFLVFINNLDSPDEFIDFRKRVFDYYHSYNSSNNSKTFCKILFGL